MISGTIVENVKDALAVGSSIIESAEKEIVWTLPPKMLVLAAQFDLIEKSKTLIEKGGHARGITHVTDAHSNVVRQLLEIGKEVRHVDRYEGAFMLVGDSKESISAVYLNENELSLDDQITAFWTEDKTYAGYLMTIFEVTWKGAISAGQKLRQL